MPALRPRIDAFLCASIRLATIVAVLWMTPQGDAQIRAGATDGSTTALGGVVSGLVVAQFNGQPVRGAVVSINAGGGVGWAATTDANGRYSIRGVPAGRYQISVSKTGYTITRYKQGGFFSSGLPIDVVDGKATSGIDFQILRAAVLGGRVVDQYGDPLARMRVQLREFVYSSTDASTSSYRAESTSNDLGEFRFFGLKPGRYYIEARPATPAAIGAAADSPETLATTYYPGVLDISQAQRITLRGGENQLELILPMQMGTAVEITGTALDTRGRPLAGRRVTAAQRTGNVLLSTGIVAPVAADGSFRISGLSPGTYVLEAAAPAPDGSGQEYATAEVSSQGGAMSGIQLIAEPPALGFGRIVVKGTGQALLRPQSVQLGARNLLVRSTTGSGLAGTIAADWTFTLRGRSGLSIVRPLILPEGWAFESVTHHGIDVTDIGVEFNPRQPVTDLEVTITSLTTHLTGTLTDPAGLAVDGYPIVVFSRDAGTWRAPTRFVQQKFADRTGTFNFHGLPPGDYFVAALSDVSFSEATDPILLKLAASRATSVTLRPQSRESVELKPIALNP